MPTPELHFRRARPEDMGRLQSIRRAAFAPVFASFRAMLGAELYELAVKRDEETRSLVAQEATDVDEFILL